MDGGTGTHVAFRIANGTRDDHTYDDGEASRTAGAYAPVMKPIHLASRAIAYPPNHFANHDFFGFCGIGVITGKPSPRKSATSPLVLSMEIGVRNS